jgi:hypothetical protein
MNLSDWKLICIRKDIIAVHAWMFIIGYSYRQNMWKHFSESALCICVLCVWLLWKIMWPNVSGSLSIMLMLPLLMLFRTAFVTAGVLCVILWKKKYVSSNLLQTSCIIFCGLHYGAVSS